MFTYGSEDQLNEPRRTGGQDPQHQRLAGTDVPNCHTKVNIPSSGQGNFSARRSSRGGSRYAPRESVNHSENPLAALEEVERQGPAQPPGLQKISAHYDCVLNKLRKEVEHEHSSRHELLTTVRRLRTDRAKDRSEFAFAHLENECETCTCARS